MGLMAFAVGKAPAVTVDIPLESGCFSCNWSGGLCFYRLK